MASTGQDEVFAFLGAPATHGLSEPVKRIDTHAATVFLAGPDVYKVKRAVRFPFLDQTTLKRRHAACDAEVAVNRRFTPHLYLGTVPITREGTALRIGGDGEAIEWAVHLKRFDETRTLDLVAERGQITDAGSGKTTLATRCAPSIGRAPGAVHLRSDIERKRLLGVPELHRLPEAAHRREVTEQVFAHLRDHAGIALRAGHGAVVDAVHLDPEERRLIADVAARAGARFVGLWLDAPIELLVARVEGRTGDASDATGAVVRRQAEADVGSIGWTRLDASVSLAALVEAACEARLTR